MSDDHIDIARILPANKHHLAFTGLKIHHGQIIRNLYIAQCAEIVVALK